MIRRTSSIIIIAALALAAAHQTAHAGENAVVSSQIVLQLNVGGDIQSVQMGATTIGSIPSQRIFLLQVPANVNMMAFLQTLLQNPQVNWAEQNYFNQCPEGSTQSFFFNVGTAGEYAGQYALLTASINQSHTITQGQGRIVAVLDTGVDVSHPALVGKIAPGGFNFVSMNSDVSDIATGTDTDGDQLFDELVGHGTFIAGAVAVTAPAAKILPVKVLDSNGAGTTFRVVQGIYHAVENGAHVINLSFGANVDSQAIAEAIQFATVSGVVLVSAAGNNGLPSVQYPAANPNVIGVTGTDALDLKAEFANYGVAIDVCAPAVSIISTLPNNQYGYGDGTSMASAMTAGVAALVGAQHPQLTPAQIRHRLMISAQAIDVLNPPYAGLLGAGRIDAHAAVTHLVVGDLNQDQIVNVADLLLLISQWGPCPAAGNCPADLDASGAVSTVDLLTLLANWG